MVVFNKWFSCGTVLAIVLCSGELTRINASETKCPIGYFGESCTSVCPANCSTLVGCHKTNGSCIECSSGRFGSQCDQQCPENCSKNCSISGSCVECNDGFYNVSNQCNNRCFITNCAECVHFSSTYFPEYCMKCKDGYYGKFCEYYCAENCLESSCSSDMLSNKPCRCKDGWYGFNCSHKCPSNCKSCLDETTCIDCNDGLKGHTCTDQCDQNCNSCSSDGLYCKACKNDSFGLFLHCQCSWSQCTQRFFSGHCKTCNESNWYTSEEGCCPCSENCKNGCHANNGSCIDGCLPNFYGDQCQFEGPRHCPNISDTDACLWPCDNGWSGDYCNFNCSVLLPHCTTCLRKEDPFPAVLCTKCEEGYTLTFDDFGQMHNLCKPCTNCLNNNCDGTQGTCLDGCQKGTYSKTSACDKLCPPLCLDGVCDEVNGTCLHGCDTGYYGPQCSKQCQFCENFTCSDTGKCIHGCQKGHYGDDCAGTCFNCKDQDCDRAGKCKLGCKPGYYNLSSYVECGLECPGCTSETCTYTNGCEDSCMPGFFGIKCDKTCSKNCFVCHRTTGECLECKSGFNGSDCSQACAENTCINQYDHMNVSEKCPMGFYGDNCSQDCTGYNMGCSVPTESHKRCDSITGVCQFGCIGDLYGPKCDQRCQNCFFGCSSNGTCKREFCKHGFYGEKCSALCPPHCNALGCHINNGSCADNCKGGYYGEYCDMACPENCSYDTCSRSDGHCTYGCSSAIYNPPNCTDAVNCGGFCMNKGPSPYYILLIFFTFIFSI